MPARGRASNASHDTRGTSEKPPSTLMNSSTWKWDLLHVTKPVEERDLPWRVSQEDDSKDDHEVSQRGEQSSEPPRDSEPSTWQRCLVVRPVEPVNNDCPRETAVEGMIQLERGRPWPDEMCQSPRLSGNLMDLLHRRIRFLFIQGGPVARDLGMVDVDEQLIAALDSLRGDV